jgi:hypothetical protein
MSQVPRAISFRANLVAQGFSPAPGSPEGLRYGFQTIKPEKKGL